MNPPQVTCVLLNYKTWADTLGCVQSLLAQDYSGLTILVVDNASPNDSVAQLRASMPPQVELLQAPANGGFASGNNLGIRQALAAGAEYIWLLNNDTVAPPGTLKHLIHTASTPNPESTGPGLTGAVLYRMQEPQTIQAWGGGTVSPLTGFTAHRLTPFIPGGNAFLTFASVLIRADVFAKIGLLDQGFFMYYEDADFCFRARCAGFALAVASDTAILHREGGSHEVCQSLFRVRTVTASGLRFLARHGHPRGLPLLLYPLSRIARRLLRLDLAGIGAVLQGVADFCRTRSWKTKIDGPGS